MKKKTRKVGKQKDMLKSSAFSPQTTAPQITPGSILQIPTAEIYTECPETALPNSKIIRLVQTVRRYGLSTPITVTPVEVFPGLYRYLVIEGDELWRAACLAELAQVPCKIAQNSPKEAEIREILAKIAAKSTDMFEKAALFRHLADSYHLTQEEISRRSGLSQSAVANKLRLLHLSAAEQRKILLCGLSERHARALIRLKDPQMRHKALETICRKNLGVCAAEALVEDILAHSVPVSPAETPQESPIAPQITANAADALQMAGKGPKLILHTLQPLYNSLERTLNIFRKTGRNALLESKQTPDRKSVV